MHTFPQVDWSHFKGSKVEIIHFFSMLFIIEVFSIQNILHRLSDEKNFLSFFFAHLSKEHYVCGLEMKERNSMHGS